MPTITSPSYLTPPQPPPNPHILALLPYILLIQSNIHTCRKTKPAESRTVPWKQVNYRVKIFSNLIGTLILQEVVLLIT